MSWDPQAQGHTLRGDDAVKRVSTLLFLGFAKKYIKVSPHHCGRRAGDRCWTAVRGRREGGGRGARRGDLVEEVGRAGESGLADAEHAESDESCSSVVRAVRAEMTEKNDVWVVRLLESR